MRSPIQTAPMPPAQAEALYDLGLEEAAQDNYDAAAVRDKGAVLDPPGLDLAAMAMISQASTARSSSGESPDKAAGGQHTP